MPPLLALWAVPRSASTAFERMVAERGDLVVVSEPFSAAYYDGPEARSERFGCSAPEATFSAVRSELLRAARERPTFVKDMAYQALPAVDATLLDGCRHTFLVRDPAWSVPSLARGWPDFTAEEVGFDAVERLVARVEDAGHEAVVLDSDDVRRRPEAVLQAWCERVGLAFRPEALAWEPGMTDGWERWQDWHGSTASSAGFRPPDPEPPTVDDERVRRAIEAARPTYEALRARRLVIDDIAPPTPPS
ncbi:hypothetical protein [Rhabdothermincola salaria]|uniref:sulfotransferase-like domain-containing protein n=1 Tax=Rhabdothermincola salaria TaxID=2903142 RepID=UPI001E62749B|nr:hypothetical protein [Rhabdothermincola salaria]MCD9623275.1 hypothetical protein [Rhabdothermincola salaria]